MPPRPRAVAVGYYVAIALLVAVLALGALLLAWIFKGEPGSGLTVTQASAVTCEPGVGAPACFNLTVRNDGAEPVSAQCLVVPAEGTSARVVGGESVTVITLVAGQARTVVVAVDPFDGGVVAPPTLSCADVPS